MQKVLQFTPRYHHSVMSLMGADPRSSRSLSKTSILLSENRIDIRLQPGCPVLTSVPLRHARLCCYGFQFGVASH